MSQGAIWRRRPWASLIVVLVGLLLALLLAMVFAREALLALVLRYALAAYGVPGAVFAVDEINLDRVVLTDVRAGDDGEVTVARVSAEFSARSLFDRELLALVLDDVALRLSVGPDGVSFGSLDPLVQQLRAGEANDDRRAATGTGAATPLPSVVLRRARVDIRSDATPAAVTFTGEARLDGTGAIAATGPLDVTSPHGAAKGTVELSGNVDGTATLAYRLTEGRWGGGDTGLAPFVLDHGTIDIEGDERRLAVVAAVRELDGRGQVEVEAEVALPLAPAEVKFTVAGNLAAASAAWSLLGAPSPRSGTIDVTLDGKVALPDGAAALPASGMLFSASTDLAFKLEVAELTHPFGLEGAAGTLSGQLTGDGEALQLGIDRASRIRLSRLPYGASALATSSPPLHAILKAPVDAQLLGAGRKPAVVTLTPTDNGYRLAGDARLRMRLRDVAGITVGVAGTTDFDATLQPQTVDLKTVTADVQDLTLPGVTGGALAWQGRLRGDIDDLSLAGRLNAQTEAWREGNLSVSEARVTTRLALKRASDGLSVRLLEPAQISAGMATLGAGLTTPDGISLSMDAASAEWQMGDAKTPLRFGATLATGDATVQRAGDVEEAPADILDAAWQRIAVEGSWSPAAGVNATVDAAGLAAGSSLNRAQLRDMAVTVEHSDARTRFAVTQAEAVDRDRPQRFAPLKLNGAGTVLRGVVDAELRLGLAARDDWPVRLSLQHDLRRGTGNARLRNVTIAFAPAGLQPKDLAAGLAVATEVSGILDAGGQMQWGAGDVAGVGQIQIADMAFATEDAKIEGLRLNLLVTDLSPLQTTPGQLLTIERVDSVVPMQDLEVRFSISAPEDDPFLPSLTIEKAEIGLLGGRVAMEPLVLAPGDDMDKLDVALRPRDFDLAELLQMVAVDGLSGSGRISGRIPVSLSAAGVTIDEAVLSATGDGLIRYQSEQASQVLGGQGEQMDLMLRALENFQYRRLTITIDKQPDGEAALALRMLGSNPDVLDGHPFQFNINLTGNVDRLVGPLLEIYRSSAGVLDRLGRPRE